MKIKIIRAGILEDFLTQSMYMDYNGNPFLEDLIDFLEKTKGPGIKEKILSGRELRDEITILINSKSIKASKKGLKSLIRNNDTIVFCLVIDSG